MSIENVKQKIKYHTLVIEDLLHIILRLYDTISADWEAKAIVNMGESIVFPCVHEADKLNIQITKASLRYYGRSPGACEYIYTVKKGDKTVEYESYEREKLFLNEITIRDSYPTYYMNYKKLLPYFSDLFMLALLLFLFLTAAYSVFVLMPRLMTKPDGAFIFYTLFGLIFLLFYPFYIIYDWLPALYGGSMIKNVIDTILSYLEPITLFPSEKFKVVSYISSALPVFTSLIVLAILQVIFYTVLSLIAAMYLARKYDNLSNLIAMPLFFFTITSLPILNPDIMGGYFFVAIIIALIMQWIIAYIFYNNADSVLDEIAAYIFVLALIPYFAGLGYTILFIRTLSAFSPPIHVLENAYSFLSTNRKYKKLLNQLGKELEIYTRLKKQRMRASQQATEAPKASQQSLPQEAKAPTTQESPKTDQQSLMTSQQTTTKTSPQIAAQQVQATSQSTQQTAPQQVQTTSQINQPSQQTAPQLQSVQQDTKTTSQQIPQMISSQPTSQQQISSSTSTQTAQQSSMKQTSQPSSQQQGIQKPFQQTGTQTAQQQEVQQSRPLQVMPLADMLIKHFEKALNHIQSIQGNPSEIYYRSVVLSYYNIINIYLRKIYYGEPLKFHHLIQYFMVRGLISKELGENLLDLSRKYWRLHNDPSFTVNQEFMQRVKSTAHQLLNELKNKKEKLEILLIEKKAHEGKLRL